MSKYTTGELAKLCGVSVRTVQYYDNRNILNPSELSEGGRRLYSEEDLKKMKVICFLRDLGLSLNSIGELMSEEDPGSVIELLLQQQGQNLQKEITEREAQLRKVEDLQRELKTLEHLTVDSIGDIAYKMENRAKMRRLHCIWLGVGIPLDIAEVAAVALWIAKGIWWPFALWLSVDLILGVWLIRYYIKRTAYICPQCHTVFRTGYREAVFANHTPSTRKLTCTYCGHKGFCVEVYAAETRKNRNATGG